VLSVFLACGYLGFLINIGDTWYLDLDALHGGHALATVLRFFSWFLLFNNFVPISLMITLELVKYI
jgi:hypothetical protein